MNSFDRTAHWENIYKTKQLTDVGWYQQKPETSLEFIKQLEIPLNASIIDIGGGDSFLVDHLLDLGYSDITVLDISGAAIERAKKRLKNNADKIEWITADVVQFKPEREYDFWHDRAAFHFLTEEEDVNKYISTLSSFLKPGGHLTIGTFSESGPAKCSGIDIKQYSEITMSSLLERFFVKLKCINIDHATPSNTIQNFLFCSFSKRKFAISK
ncbi:class I SAM-dependent methyltransferase [Bacteroidota bacterium]